MENLSGVGVKSNLHRTEAGKDFSFLPSLDIHYLHSNVTLGR